MYENSFVHFRNVTKILKFLISYNSYEISCSILIQIPIHLLNELSRKCLFYQGSHSGGAIFSAQNKILQNVVKNWLIKHF